MSVETFSSFADFRKKLTARAKDIKERMESMRGKSVVVGIPPSAEYPNGKSVVEVAQLITDGVLENGYPSSKPPRPFIRLATEENQSKWGRKIQEGIREALRRRQRPNLRPVLMKVGERMKKDIQAKMLELEVYDTGRMHDSISVLSINGREVTS